MAEPDVPRPDDNDGALPPGAGASPARVEVGCWRAVWDLALEHQAEHGTAGGLDDWASALEIAVTFATKLTPELARTTRDDLADFEAFLERLELVAGRLGQVVTPDLPPGVVGAVLDAVEVIREGLRLTDPTNDVRVLSPVADPVVARRLGEQDAIIGFHAGFAANRTRELADLRARLDEQSQIITEMGETLGGCCQPVGSPVVDLLHRADIALGAAEARLGP